VSGGTGWVEHTIRIPDIDGDCVDEVGVSSWTPTTRILSGQTGLPIWTNTVGGCDYDAEMTATLAGNSFMGPIDWRRSANGTGQCVAGQGQVIVSGVRR
jgi:hypothetical protein